MKTIINPGFAAECVVMQSQMPKIAYSSHLAASLKLRSVVN